MELSEQAKRLMREGGLVIELEAIVIGTRTFKANGQDVAKVTVNGSPRGPMGHGVECIPYGIFELDAEMAVFHQLGKVTEPKRFKFRADLKPINTSNGYVVHLLEIIEQ
jgi:hypothetical protein